MLQCLGPLLINKLSLDVFRPGKGVGCPLLLPHQFRRASHSSIPLSGKCLPVAASEVQSDPDHFCADPTTVEQVSALPALSYCPFSALPTKNLQNAPRWKK